VLSLSSIVIAACVGLASGSTELPEIAIIIDDIGYRYDHSRAAIELQQSFAYAILPFSPHAQTLAHLANALDKDVMVHLPMEADDDNHLLGPGALRFNMSRREIEDAFLESLAAVPYAVGINNHMGSRLTRERSHMNWLMHAIRERGKLFFVDSRTTSRSVAGALAYEAGIATADRDVFLDNIKTEAHIREQLHRLVERAKKNGRALGIAHPHPETIQVLRNWQPSKSGIHLVRIGEYVRPRRADGGFMSGPSDRLGSTTPECSDQSANTNPAQDPDAQR
jgi:uncharacterized protein